MKYFYISLIFSCFSAVNGASQDNNQNYIRSRIMLTENDTSKYIEIVQYYDGLGRPCLNVQKDATPSHSNLITLQEYDELGRKSKTWLPHITTSNYLLPTIIKNEVQTTYNKDSRPFSESIYEISPLNRIVKQYGAGIDWVNHPISTEYTTNNATNTLCCKLYQVNTSGSLIQNGNYPPNTLYVSKETDENNNISYTFTDISGHVILNRQLCNGIAHDTYHVYDNFYNLRFVLPPAYQDTPNLALYAYQYKYDKRNRCIEKTLPGCQPIYYVYDKADNLILSQDGVQRESGKWDFFLYDRFHRLTIKGTSSNINISSIKNTIITCSLNKGTNGLVTETGINNSGYSTTLELPSSFIIHQINYYDDYSFLSLSGFQDYHKFSEGANASSFLTGSITSILDSRTKLYKTIYYDTKGRPIQVIENDHLGGHKISTTNYTFTGKTLMVNYNHHTADNLTKIELYKYTYDHIERLKKVTHQLDNNTITLSENTYDELGRLSTKTYHNNNALKNTYTYNIRNWIISISSPKFTENLYYNKKNEDNTPCYDGNISQMSWSVASEVGLTRNYKFEYDELSRLKKAIYGENNKDPNYCPDYTVEYLHDKMGNLTLIRRYGLLNKPDNFDMIDDLFIDYNGNQLKAIEDNSAGDPLYEGAFNFVNGSSKLQEYFYDANGNLIKDLNKESMSIQYNNLNLPSQIIIAKSGYINYQYDTDGIKLHKESFLKFDDVTIDPFPGFQSINNIAPITEIPKATLNLITESRTHYKAYTYTDYCGNFIYEDGKLSKILTEEGYITFNANGNIPTYHYYLQDHLGNNRIITKEDGEIEEVNHYYPYGGLFGEGINTSKQLYKYGNKELDRMHGLDWYDLVARPYDAVLGCFPTMDLLCEEYYSTTPYGYCTNNPIKYTDPNGKKKVIYNPDGTYKETKFNNWFHNTFWGIQNFIDYGNNQNLVHLSDNEFWQWQITNHYDNVNQTSSITNIEFYVDAPATGFINGIEKYVASSVYSYLDSPHILLTGKRLSGSSTTPDEKMSSFIDVSTSIFPSKMLGRPNSFYNYKKSNTHIQTKYKKFTYDSEIRRFNSKNKNIKTFHFENQILSPIIYFKKQEDTND